MLKHNKKIKLINKGLVLLLCVLLTIAFTGCGKQVKQAETTTSQVENNGNEQLHSFVIPKSIMKEDETKHLIESFKNGTAIGTNGEQIYTNIYANDDGTVTYVFTDGQLEKYKAYFRQFFSYDTMVFEGSGVKNIEITEDLTEIVLYVGGYDKYNVSDVTAKSMGLYQIMNGVAPDEWHAKVTVKDYETGKVISEDSYPKE